MGFWRFLKYKKKNDYLKIYFYNKYTLPKSIFLIKMKTIKIKIKNINELEFKMTNLTIHKNKSIVKKYVTEFNKCKIETINTDIKKFPLLHFTDIDTFYLNKNRSQNDENNNIREYIFYCFTLNKIPSKWNNISLKWSRLHQCVNELTMELYKTKSSNISIEIKGGRMYNYDFLTIYKNITKKLEFKHNVSKISACPQFLSMSSNNFIEKNTITYHCFFYDNYISQIAKLYGIVRPDKDEYILYIHRSKYSNHLFFQTLYDVENVDLNKKKIKKEIVKKSIYEYLKIVKINVPSLVNKLQETQYNKFFILWNKKKFIIDKINKNELTILNIIEIKNKNTLVFKTNSNTKIKMLLRWKNHLGVLYPAWQISLTRK